MNKLELLRRINLMKYIYMNYFCKSVERKNNARIIPYKHAVIELEKGSRLIVGGDLEIGTNLIKGSKAETRVRLRKNAVWNAEECCSLSYGTTLEVLDNGVLNTKYFTMNCNCTMIVAKEIDIGHDVMLGRGVIIYDSDYHSIFSTDNMLKNVSQPVIIDSHVWVASNAMILKGSHIREGAIVAANTTITGIVEKNTLIKNSFPHDRISGLRWDRKKPE